MTSRADAPIAALRTGLDELAAHVRALSPAELTGPSGASEWTVAQVLSHLGSGAEIGLAGLEVALDAADAIPADFNSGVWARWDAMSPDEQAAGFLAANETFVARYEAIDEAGRDQLRINMGFLPEPADLATHASFRLNEFALHSWDVRVVKDQQATVAPDAVEPILGVLPFLLGWVGKPATVLDGRALTVAVHLTEPEKDFGLDLADSVALVEVPADPDGSLVLPAESWLRLATGRLAAASTPAGVSVTGPLSLDDLRRIFPGY